MTTKIFLIPFFCFISGLNPLKAQLVSTFAGSGNPGLVDAQGTAARFNNPQYIAVDNSGNLYVSDAQKNVIRKITPNGDVSTFAGSGSPGSNNGQGTAASFNNLSGLAVDGQGNVYVADRRNHLIRKITPSGNVTTFAGSGSPGSTNSLGKNASFNYPTGLAVDNLGNVYVTDQGNYMIRKISPNGEVSTFAGSGMASYADGKGTAASFTFPVGIAIDGSGNLYISDIADFHIRKISPLGEVSTFAGSGMSIYTDGIGKAASFSYPYGLAVDVSGNVYVTDTYINRIRKITSNGEVSSFAGSGQSDFANGAGTAASFNKPYGVVVDVSGNIYVADAQNNAIRKITACPTYTITPTTISNAYVGEDFSSQPLIVTSNNGSATNGSFSISSVPSDFTFDGITGVLKSTSPPTVAKTTPFTINYTNINGCKLDFPQSYTLAINTRQSSNLTISNIETKTYGTDPFKIKTYSRSTGKITFIINPTINCCASFDNNTNLITITCGGTEPNNIISITAVQEAEGIYKAENVTTTFKINPAPGRLDIKNYAFLLNSQSAINVFAKSKDGLLTFEQQSGFGVATVDLNGNVQTASSSGEFKVHISVSATNNYTAFDSTYTFNVNKLQKPPIAINDTIVLEMGKDTIINILQNDKGQNGEIISNKTDIDIENVGQQIKYYSTALGNFNIDALGNLTIRPFDGFIGGGKIGYTVSDINGLSSNIAYVEIMVKTPYVLPALKANEVMTPNNDTYNDELVIAYACLDTNNSLTIFDEAGNAVYEKTNYQNDWRGIDSKGMPVEAGVYFYVYDEKISGRGLKQYIQVIK